MSDFEQFEPYDDSSGPVDPEVIRQFDILMGGILPDDEWCDPDMMLPVRYENIEAPSALATLAADAHVNMSLTSDELIYYHKRIKEGFFLSNEKPIKRLKHDYVLARERQTIFADTYDEVFEAAVDGTDIDTLLSTLCDIESNRLKDIGERKLTPIQRKMLARYAKMLIDFYQIELGMDPFEALWSDEAGSDKDF
ncbi:MAG: hypothetical protein JWL89_519 [Candidatus Saccharibacteria bacterium]|nr:hypothetical protein [Candidatus Saccharibacteria bacterium]